MAKEKYWLPDPSFPGKQQWPCSFALRDELYQIKDYSRDKVRVLMRLDPSKIDMKNKKVHRTDGDFAVTWAETYGKGPFSIPASAMSPKTGTILRCRRGTPRPSNGP
jgi:type 1 glutamine amidotransferase